MKNSSLIVRIPEPCHEDWNKMTPDDKGRFCGSCSKSVFDFSNKTDIQIRDILMENKDKKVCGHFRRSQIDRPLNITIDLNDLPRNMSITKMFTIALFLVFGTFLFSCTDINGKKIDGIELTNSKDEMQILGEMNMSPIELVKGDSIAEPDSLVEQTLIMEEMVNGGISSEQIMPQENLPIENAMIKGDTMVEETLNTVPDKNYLRGAICVINHIPADSSELNEPDSVLINERIGNIGILLKNAKELTVFPNPTSGEFTLKYDVNKRCDVRVDVLDMNGMLLKNLLNIKGQYEGKYQIPVSLNEFSAGTYFVSLLNNGKRSTEKVIIAK